jgi:dTDP-4-dehydrorhamnose 3,5-epimerase
VRVEPTSLPGVMIVEPRVFADPRGFFMETYQKARFEEAGLAHEFVQDNQSHSIRGTLRGLHYQIQHPQGKLVRVVRGEVFDVAVDLRRSRPTFGRWIGIYLSEENKRQLYIPPGFAHGFCVISEEADFFYKCTDYYHPESERTVLWNDAALGIDWPVREPLVSDKDRQGAPLSEAETFD